MKSQQKKQLKSKQHVSTQSKHDDNEQTNSKHVKKHINSRQPDPIQNTTKQHKSIQIKTTKSNRMKSNQKQ